MSNIFLENLTNNMHLNVCVNETLISESNNKIV